MSKRYENALVSWLTDTSPFHRHVVYLVGGLTHELFGRRPPDRRNGNDPSHVRVDDVSGGLGAELGEGVVLEVAQGVSEQREGRE